MRGSGSVEVSEAGHGEARQARFGKAGQGTARPGKGDGRIKVRPVALE